MSWITPKTDWLETDRCTYADINRIAGNVNELLDVPSLKDDYIQGDVITLAEWEAILQALDDIAIAAGYNWEDFPDATVSALNFNLVESFTLGLKDWIDIIERQQSAYVYLGDAAYLGEGEYLR